MYEYSELEEFSTNVGRYNEMVDSFYEEKSYSKSCEDSKEDFKLSTSICSNMIHYS